MLSLSNILSSSSLLPLSAYNCGTCFWLLPLLAGAAPVMDESAGLAVGSTSFGGKEDERDGLLLFLASAFWYL
jgi:hypothetical protein